jgi:hypothetical protein
MEMEEKEKNETIDPEIDDKPIYFAPKRVSLISDSAGILSWIVLVGFIADLIGKVIGIQEQMKTGNLLLSTLIKESSFISYLITNLAVPLFTGLTLFFILQAAATGLNFLLEMDFKSRETQEKPEA